MISPKSVKGCCVMIIVIVILLLLHFVAYVSMCRSSGHKPPSSFSICPFSLSVGHVYCIVKHHWLILWWMLNSAVLVIADYCERFEYALKCGLYSSLFSSTR